jgi:acetyltransferase-like isoleucine patch superfamily enzyme
MKRTDTKIRSLLTNEEITPSQAYKAFVVGDSSTISLLKYEMITLLCSWLPGAIGYFLRSKLYPLILGKVGRGVIFGQNVTIRHPQKIFIGDNVVIDDNCLLDAKGINNKGIIIGDKVFLGRNSILSCKDGDIYLNDGVNIGFNCEIYSSNQVSIGKNTVVAAYSYFIGGGNYDTNNKSVSFAEQDGLDSRGGIRVGSNCWIGADVKVLDGVEIGTGSVIGTGAVVRETIPPDSLAVGIPARIIKSRELNSQIEI